MSDKVVDDVKGTVVFLLGELRSGLLANAAYMTPEKLVDTSIAETLDVIERHFELTSQLVTTPEGLPLSVDGLVQEYWDMVNDDGQDRVVNI